MAKKKPATEDYSQGEDTSNPSDAIAELKSDIKSLVEQFSGNRTEVNTTLTNIQNGQADEAARVNKLFDDLDRQLEEIKENVLGRPQGVAKIDSDHLYQVVLESCVRSFIQSGGMSVTAVQDANEKKPNSKIWENHLKPVIAAADSIHGVLVSRWLVD